MTPHQAVGPVSQAFQTAAMVQVAVRKDDELEVVRLATDVPDGFKDVPMKSKKTGVDEEKPLAFFY